MATTSKVLYRGAATTTTTATLYTVPSATTTVVTDIVVTNATGAAGTFTISMDGVLIAPTCSIPANSTAQLEVKQVLTANKAITGGASATTVNFHISGVEII